MYKQEREMLIVVLKEFQKILESPNFTNEEKKEIFSMSAKIIAMLTAM